MSKKLFQGFTVTIPFSDVSHVYKRFSQWYENEEEQWVKDTHDQRVFVGYTIITKHTTFDPCHGYNNEILTDIPEGERFIKEWEEYLIQRDDQNNTKSIAKRKNPTKVKID